MDKEEIKHFKKGEIIFREGDAGDNLFIIKSGKVGIFRGKKDSLVLLSTPGPGEFFGEMAILGSEKKDHFRTATVQALEDTSLISINKFKMHAIFSKVPHWFITIFNAVIERLRHMDFSIKSKFRMGMAYSILNFIFLYSKVNGIRTDNDTLLVDSANLEEEICDTLGISEDYYHSWLKDLVKTHLLREREKNTKIEIVDTEKIRNIVHYIKTGKISEEMRPNADFEKILSHCAHRNDSFYIFAK